MAVDLSARTDSIEADLQGRRNVSGTVSLGESQLRAGRLEEAHARTYQERGREPPERVQAEAHSRQALTLAEELGMRPLQAHCHCGLGTLYVTSG